MSYWQRIHKNLNKELDDENEKLDSSKFSSEHLESNTNDEVKIVHPLGNYLIKNSSKQRKYASLFGISEKVKKDEIIENEQKMEDKPDTEIETWDKNRDTLKEYSERDRRTAMKRDELPEYDEDGYRFSPETPTFRHGFNPTLRIKPTQNPDLHNGKIVNVSGREIKGMIAPTLQQGSKSEKDKVITRQESFNENNAKGESLTQTRQNNTEKEFIRHNTKETHLKPMLKLMKTQQMYMPPNKRSLRKSLLKRDSIHKTLALLVLRAITQNELGINPEQRKSILSTMKSGEVVLEELGKAFVELGLVLTPELREESKRKEFKGRVMDTGKKIMLDLNTPRGETPFVEEALKPDLALAVARTLENLKSFTLPNQDGRNIGTPEIETTRRKNELHSGTLTLQIISTVSARAEQKGRISHFRNEEMLSDVPQLQGAPVNVNAQFSDSAKSIWDGFAKEEYVNDRSLLPSRPSHL
jgi:hypothetical protein